MSGEPLATSVRRLQQAWGVFCLSLAYAVGADRVITWMVRVLEGKKR